MIAFATKSMADWRHGVLLLGMGAAIAMVLYTTLYWDSNPPPSLLSNQPDKNRIDLFVEQMHGVKFDSTGKLVETLWAQRLDHYPERGESILAEPVLEAQDKDNNTWKITALTGTLIGDDELRLKNNVVIVDQTHTQRFESERLDYFSNKQLATTDAAVKLQHADDVTTAIGMRAHLDTNRIQLLHKVDSHFAPIDSHTGTAQ